MLEERVKLLRRWIDAYNRGDYITATEGAHPDIELVPPGDQPPYRGIEQLRDWMKPDAFSKQSTEAGEFRAVDDDRVLVLQHTWVTGASTGIEMDFDAWFIWSFDDAGLVTRVEVFLDRDSALEAAGLSE